MKKRLILFVTVCLCLLPVCSMAGGLRISEVCSNNDWLWELHFQDYIELYNEGDEEAELSQYALSRDKDDPLKCVLPSVTVAPGAYVLLCCDGVEVSFNLPKEGCALYLTEKNTLALADRAQVPAMEDAVWTFDAGVTDMPSPGQPNTQEGFEAYRAGLRQTLVINEVVSANAGLLEVDGKTPDLIELMNVGDEPVSLADYYLSDKKKELRLCALPDIVLEPGQCAVVYASGEERRNHVAFKVSSGGETLYLSDQDGNCIDALRVPALEPDVSYGRMDNALVYFEKPTIGAPNGQGVGGKLKTPAASMASGFYNEPFSVTLSGEGELRYSLDGTDPRKGGTVWDGTPLTIDRSTIVRVCAAQEGRLGSAVSVYHYLFDCEKYELPVLSLSSAPDRILGSRGLWGKYENHSMEVETHAAYFEGGEERFSLFCGLRLHGQGSRALGKKSMQLRFRSQYGQSTLNYPLFDGIDFRDYDAVVLRSGSEDYKRAFLRDEFMTSLMAETMPAVLYQANKPVNLFIDGQYMGIYFFREKLNDTYVSYHLGGTPEGADMVRGWSAAEHGSADDFRELLRACKRKKLSNAEAFEEIAAQLSLESFMDYYIGRAYTGDRDYPNIRHARAEGGKWHIINFDLDWGFGTDPARFGSFIGTVKDSSAQNTVIINALLQNADFRSRMLERIAWHFENTFEPSRVIAHLDAMVEVLRHDMAYDRERWNVSMEDWEWHLEFLRNFARERIPTLVESARVSFRMTKEEMELYFGKWL